MSLRELPVTDPPVPRKISLADNVDYAVIDEGVGDAVILLHGFPDSARLWRHQIPALVDAGYRAIAPDFRGFGESSKPVAVEQYRMVRIIGDISSLMRELGIRRAHVVGHDWGAAVAWTFAALMPSKVDHLVAISVGHPNVFHAPSVEQRRRSWYMLLYQFEGVAEELLQRQNWRLFREWHGDSVDVERSVVEMARPGALTAALNWYRANRSPALELEPPPRLPLIKAPTLGVWGDGDEAILEEGMLESRAFVQGPWRYERVPDAGHWVPLSERRRLNDLLLSFLGSHSSQAPAPRMRRRF